jgi:hypothetical protein
MVEVTESDKRSSLLYTELSIADSRKIFIVQASGLPADIMQTLQLLFVESEMKKKKVF